MGMEKDKVIMEDIGDVEGDVEQVMEEGKDMSVIAPTHHKW